MEPYQFRTWRKAEGLTQAEAAEALGLKKPTVTLYERGTRYEDGSPVVIPRAIELACAAISELRERALPTAEDADRVAVKRDFVLREPAARVRRTRIDGPIDVLSIKGPLEIVNKFKTICNEEGHMSYWQGLLQLMKDAGR